MIPAPAAPEVVAAQAWAQAARVIDDDIKTWVRRIERGDRPLTVSEARRLEGLITSAGAMLPMTVDQAQMAGSMTATELQAMRRTLTETLRTVPPHAQASVADFYQQVGWKNQADSEALRSAIRRSQEAITKDFTHLADDMQRRIADEVVRATAQGLGPDEMARNLRRANSTTTSLGSGRSRTIARTELADVYDNARYSEMNRYGDLLYGYEWDARNDSCDICAALHGMIFPVDQPPNRHHNCRCVSIPVLPDEELANTPLGQPGPNASTDPAVMANRDRLMQKQAPQWRPYWAMGSPDQAAAWRASRPGLPATPAPKPPRGLTPEEMRGNVDYTVGNWTGADADRWSMLDEYKGDADLRDSLDLLSTDAPVLWRGMHFDSGEMFALFDDMRPGDVFKNHGISSFTEDANHAKFFMGADGDGVRIRLTGGRGVNTLKHGSNSPAEAEWLVMEDLRVTKITRTPIDVDGNPSMRVDVEVERINPIRPIPEPVDVPQPPPRVYEPAPPLETGAQFDEWNDWMTSTFLKPTGGLPMSSVKAADLYVSNDALTLANNRLLREGGWPGTWADDLDNAIARCTIDRDVVLYRGAVMPESEIEKMTPGARMTDKGFQSTAVDREDAEFYASERKADGAEGMIVEYEIRVPKGYSGMDVGTGEIVLPRDTVSRIVSSSRDGDVWRIVLEVDGE